MNDDLRNSLTGIADDVRYVDLHQRALGRSRQIRRNRVTAATASALAVLGLAGFGAVTLGGERPDKAPPVAASVPVSPSTAVSIDRSSTPSGPATVTMAAPRSTSLTDLTGHVFYRSPQNGSVVRITGAGDRSTVLSKANQAVAVAPDGEKIAYIANDRVYLSGSDQPAVAAKVDLHQQLPAWSPDGAQLFVAAPDPGVLTVATGKFGPIPGGLTGTQFHWSGDGGALVHLTDQGRLRVADRTVPVWGEDAARNPEGLRGIPASVDLNGRRVTMTLSGALALDDGRPLQSDTVVDTVTGELQPIPVAGDVQAAVFDTAGNLLVRAKDGDRLVLSVFAADGTLLVQAPEPGSVKDLEMLAYTK
ncbi:hypothetical protein [Actinoplanes sp. L3-i22]|uniref:hypothetical protein n=1 Tax=Actinoplanes sp. L3-i22 TaxID=2836373 RepID=UPI001C74495D|nr:hypothetical protein [Actinoplanes sp. L3-i22]BCY05765.1 hypothetical protein L3i22_008530 [Actinoplanes sp. L3-i22]